MKCIRCDRRLKREPPPEAHSMGPICARAAFGAKPKRIPREDRRSADDRQRALFAEAQA